jgi:hypothetical protein
MAQALSHRFLLGDREAGDWRSWFETAKHGGPMESPT